MPQLTIFFKRLNWEFWTGIVIFLTVLSVAVFVRYILPSEKTVRDDCYCTPSLLGTSVKSPVGLSLLHKENSTEQQSGDDMSLFLQDKPVEKEKDSCSRPYLFGTDLFGKDWFLLTFNGSLEYIQPGIAVAIIAVIVGSLLGVFNGYYETGLMKQASSIFSNSISVYPPLILLILITRIGEGNSLLLIGLVFGITEATRVGNSISSKIRVLRDEEFIASAREMGLSDWRIITRHILWYNCRELLLIHMTFAVSSFIMMELYLGYLNVGNFQAWGTLIGSSAKTYHSYHWLLLFPTGVVVLTIISFYFIGDGIMKFVNNESEQYR